MNQLSSLRLKVLTLLFVLVTAVLLANGWLLSSNIDELNRHQKSVERTHTVLSQLESTLSDVRAAESQSRAYMLSKDKDFLGTYRINIESAWSHFNQAESMFADNPHQVEAGNRLKVNLANRIDALDQTIADFERHGRVDEGYFLKGAQYMRDLRTQVDRMEQEEERLLQARSEQSAKSYNYVQITLGAVTLLNFLLAVGVFVLIRRQIIRQAEELEEQTRESRLRTGEADAAKLVAGENPIEEMAQQTVEFISRDLNVPGVNFFIIEGGRAQLIAGYGAGGGQKVADVLFDLGKGLIGSAAIRESVMQISEVPEDYFRIVSSWGAAVPKTLAFAPLRFQGKPVGLLEIASFRELSAADLDWLEVVGKAIGTGVSASVSRQHLQSLLEETQRQSEELQTQQEELRTSNEELEEQTRALMQTQERLQVQQEELQQINEELEQQTRALEGQREILNERNHDLEVQQSETARKAQELERISQYKSEFLAKMSHELRTPLNSLMILATLLHENKQGNLSTQQVDFARTIFEAGGDLLNLINDILDLSKLEARKLTARPEPFSVRTFFDQAVSTFRPMVEPKGLALRVHIEESVPERMVTDRQRLQQILRNLLSNAVKFTEQGEVTVLVSPGASKGRVRIAVKDTGVGIPEEKKQLIFEAFEQADGSVSRKYGGTGLGLTISRELAGLLGGQISVESEPGQGSCFTIEIPIELNALAEKGSEDGASNKSEAQSTQLLKAPMPSEAVVPVARKGSDESPGKKVPSEVVARLLAKIPQGAKTILIVEDDSNFRASVAEAAKGHGFFPIEVGDGESALEVLHAHVPQAILLDIRLPGVSGLTLLEVVKEMPEMRHVPIHMISALEHQQNALRMGAIGYLGKPVTIEGVRSALSRIESVISREVKRLLVVEDDMTQRKAISELVQGGDVEIVGVGTGREAIEVLSKSVIDCVILDLSLPDYSGFELLERLNEREDVSLPPVIIYTGKDLSKEEEEKLRRYSDSIIIKGAKSPERLLDEVSLFLHRVETALPEEKRAMLADLRNKDRAFDGRNILVVDDDLRNVFALTSALESKGFHVKVARNGLEALETLDTDASIDVVLMDIMMPKMDGFEAMKRIRANPAFRKLPIIALTAKTMKGEYERCIQAGASDYLPKPINLPSLLSVLKVWLPAPGIMA